MGMGGVKNVSWATAVFLAMLANGAHASDNISIIYGQKSLEASDWEPVDSHTEFGVGVEFQKPEWPVALVASYLTSKDSATVPALGVNLELTGKTTELGIGARKYLTDSGVRFFVEGGLASVSAEITVGALGVSFSDSGSAVGFWLGAGVDMMMGDVLSLGFFARLSDATVDLAGVDGAAGGTHVNVFAAYHFGK